MVQRGYRGTGMDQVVNTRELAIKAYANQLPAVDPPADLTGVPSSQVYSNVQVLGDIDAAELTRLMTAMTNWVAPQQGCSYCHENENLASDALLFLPETITTPSPYVSSEWTICPSSPSTLRRTEKPKAFITANSPVVSDLVAAIGGGAKAARVAAWLRGLGFADEAIADSPGFVLQRVLALVADLGCGSRRSASPPRPMSIWR